MINFNQYVVRDSSGAVNVDETLNKFALELEAWDSKNRADLETVTGAIHKVFDKFYAVKSIQKPALLTLVLGELQVTPGTHAEVLERICGVLKTDPCFTVAKGKNGGVSRKVAEVPQAAE